MILLLVLIALLQQPFITATWQGDILVIDASPGSLYLVGDDRQETYIGQEHVTLPAGGVDQNYAPEGRTIELRNANSQTVYSLAVPVPNQVILPMVVR